jgi:hypothetical protein
MFYTVPPALLAHRLEGESRHQRAFLYYTNMLDLQVSSSRCVPCRMQASFQDTMNNLQALLMSANFAMAYREKLNKLFEIDEVMDMLWDRARTPIISSHITMLREEVGSTAFLDGTASPSGRNLPTDY